MQRVQTDFSDVRKGCVRLFDHTVDGQWLKISWRKTDPNYLQTGRLYVEGDLNIPLVYFHHNVFSFRHNRE